MWLYEDKEVDELPPDCVGFVYLITNVATGRMYIGKKGTISTRRVKVKNRKSRKVVRKESDWRTYYGSSAALLLDVEACGKNGFKREITRFCRSKAEMSYYEIKQQIDNEVLFKPDLYYNNFVGCRIHAKHFKT